MIRNCEIISEWCGTKRKNKMDVKKRNKNRQKVMDREL